MSWLCLEVADGAVIRGAFCLVLDVYGNTTWRTTLYEWILNHGVFRKQCQIWCSHVFTYFWTWFTWLIVWLCQENCVQMLSSFMSVGKFVADRFQPSLSRLSRRATLPLCRQRSGLFSRDHWKDRIMCRSWSLFKCRQQHFPSKVMGSQGNACGSTFGTKWNWTLACLLTSTHWYTLHLNHKSGSPERPRNAFHCLCLQSGKTIWANVLSICRIHITSNCCRLWLGSRETWRSPQFLWCSLRHFDLSQKQEVLRLLSMLFNCFCLADVAVIRGAFCLVLDVWPHYLTDYAVTNKFWTTEFSASSARFGARMCLPISGPGSPD